MYVKPYKLGKETIKIIGIDKINKSSSAVNKYRNIYFCTYTYDETNTFYKMLYVLNDDSKSLKE